MATKVLSRTDIMTGLSDLRDEGLLCDIKLEAEGKVLSAHRAVLAAVSPYFKALFTGGFKENAEDTVELKGLSYDGLSEVVNCFYSTNLKLDPENVSAIMTTAIFLQITPIVDCCKAFLRSNLSDSTCFNFLKLAERFEFQDVAQKANEYILDNFRTVHKNKDFLKISKDALVQYLNHDELNASGDENEVFKAAKDWLEVDEERLTYVEEIMSSVRFHLIKAERLCEIGDLDLIDNSKECRSLVRKALAYHSNEFKKPLIKNLTNKPRGTERLFLIDNGVGPDWQNEEDNQTYLYSLSNGQSDKAKNIGRFLTFTMKVVQRNNFLFLFAVDNETFLLITMRYDASSNTWMSLAPVPLGKLATVGYSVASLGTHIYFLSGMYITEEMEHFTIEGDKSSEAFRYNIATNEWNRIKNIPTPSYFSAAAGCPVNGCIYVSGGYTHETGAQVLNTMFAYDTIAQLWLSKSPMKYERYTHSLECIKSKLYAVGGNKDAPWIEEYDPSVEQWTDIDTSLGGTDSFVVVQDEKIFILGGHWRQPDEDFSSSKPDVMAFDTITHKLTTYNITLPKPMRNHVGGLLVIP